MIAALFVAPGGCYFGLPDVDPWDEQRDARLYAGPWPVVAHPPCERWGRYWSGGPSAHVRRVKGDDNGCFASALVSVRRWGGVLEHPEATHAWAAFGLPRPARKGWTAVMDGYGGWVCQVAQANYGHRARKLTWLYVGGGAFPRFDLNWDAAKGERLDEGFHNKAERIAARAAGQPPRRRLSHNENLATPVAFRDLLMGIARTAQRKAA